MIDARNRHGNPSHANESGTTELTRGLIEDVMIPKGDTKIAKTGQRQCSGLRISGSPYQIRTGDLRLERDTSARKLRAADVYKRASEQVFCEYVR